MKSSRNSRKSFEDFVLLRRRRGGFTISPTVGTAGTDEGVGAITVFAGEGPKCIVDQLARTPEQLIATLADALMGFICKLVVGFDVCWW